VKELANKLGTPVPTISRGFLARLDAHETALILGSGETLEVPEDFAMRSKRTSAKQIGTRFESAVRDAIEHALRESRGKIYGSGSAR
jgi:hypothetical protein